MTHPTASCLAVDVMRDKSGWCYFYEQETACFVHPIPSRHVSIQLPPADRFS